MALWKIEPVAASDDPAWQGRAQWASVVVRAANPAFARALARALDTPDTAPEYGDEHPRLGSGFSSEKLYRVVPLESPAYADEGPDAILEQQRRMASPPPPAPRPCPS